MEKTVNAETPPKKFSKIGYYGRPITDLSREELLAAFAELVDLYNQSRRKINKCRKALGKEKFDAL